VARKDIGYLLFFHPDERWYYVVDCIAEGYCIVLVRTFVTHFQVLDASTFFSQFIVMVLGTVGTTKNPQSTVFFYRVHQQAYPDRTSCWTICAYLIALSVEDCHHPSVHFGSWLFRGHLVEIESRASSWPGICYPQATVRSPQVYPWRRNWLPRRDLCLFVLLCIILE